MYYDGFVAEGLLTDGSESEDPVPELDYGVPPRMPSRGEVDPVTASSQELHDMGLRVIRGGRV